MIKLFKSIWTTLTGSISSIIPLFFACCKSGACTAVCFSPVASILGISSASLVASPLMQSFYPVLLIISSVSFTVSYYKIYILPKYMSGNCETDCDCSPKSNTIQEKITVWSFWIGLIASIIFFTYFEFQNYNANIESKKAFIELQKNQNTKSTDSTESETSCCSPGQKCN